MIRIASLIGACIATVASPAAAASSRVDAHAVIVQPGAIRLQLPTAMPSVIGTARGAAFLGLMPSLGFGSSIPVLAGNARLIVRRVDASGAPVTAPASFEILRTREEDAVILRTGGIAEQNFNTDDDFVVGGSLPGATAASIDVGARLSLASNTGLGPAPGARMLVVLVQYN